MNILMMSINFYPSVGGIEIITENLANEFVRQGHSVTVVTNTPIGENREKVYLFKLLRNPSFWGVFQEYRKCDVYVHQAISLKYIWPLFLLKKPFFIVYHQVGWQRGIKGLLKKAVSILGHHICVSNTVAKGYKLKSYDVIYNAYDNEVFNAVNEGRRADILFVGRLSKDKGGYLLIDAFNGFKRETGSDYHLNIIGDGPERKDIEAYASSTQFSQYISFLGQMSSKQVAHWLNRSHILAVPSTHPYYEAFGIVVLEGLACGCTVVGSDGDGIEEALHSAGILYKNGSWEDLCNALVKAYEMSEKEVQEKRKIAKEWLVQRRLSNVAFEYIKIFRRIHG